MIQLYILLLPTIIMTWLSFLTIMQPVWCRSLCFAYWWHLPKGPSNITRLHVTQFQTKTLAAITGPGLAELLLENAGAGVVRADGVRADGDRNDPRSKAWDEEAILGCVWVSDHGYHKWLTIWLTWYLSSFGFDQGTGGLTHGAGSKISTLSSPLSLPPFWRCFGGIVAPNNWTTTQLR